MKEGLLNKELTIKDILIMRSKALHLDLNFDLSHPTSQGDQCEGKWIEFLKSFLPNRYAVAKGFVFDSKGSISDQIDVIIYDPHHSPLIFIGENDEHYVTAESVYAVFEVKPKANKGNMAYAQEKIGSVRDMHRTSREIISSGQIMKPRDLTRIIGGLLCSDSIGQKSLMNAFNECSSLDIVCIPETTTLFHRSDGSCAESNDNEALHAFFYLLLDELYKLGTVAAIDIREYADIALDSFELERGSRDVSE